MRSRGLLAVGGPMLDAETQAFLAAAVQQDPRLLHEVPVDEARQGIVQAAKDYGPGPAMARVHESSVATDDGDMAVRALVPCANANGVLVYYHGGGWAIGDVAQAEPICRHIAARTRCVVVLPDYRQAPEHRYPTAVEDAWAALLWASDNLALLAGREVPLLVAGDSAGGNLAAVVARRARDCGTPRIAMQVLVYPVTDCDLDTPSYRDRANQLILTREAMTWFWDMYVPDAIRRHEPDASPARARDLTRLPRAVVLTAEHDVLRDEGEEYARQLAAAGVAVEHRRFLGQMHGFFPMLNVLPGSSAALDYVVDAISDVLATDGDNDPTHDAEAMERDVNV